MNSSNHFLFLVVPIILLACVGCASPPPVAVSPATVKWSYAGSRADVDLTAAVIKPSVGNQSGAELDRAVGNTKVNAGGTAFVMEGTEDWGLLAGAEVSRLLKPELEGLLTDMGLRLRGSFDEVEEITYPDKQATDWYLFGRLDVQAATSNLVIHPGFASATYEQTLTGSATFSLRLFEPLSGELFWQKRLTLPELKSEFTCDSSGRAEAITFMERSTRNELERWKERIVVTVLEELSKFLTTQELTRLKTLADEVKAKKRY